MKDNTMVVDFNEFSNAKKILLVEDDVDNQEFLMEVFDNCGLEMEIAHNGKEAVALYEKNKYYDLVLMDLRMPEMSGFVATEKILQINPNAIIIAQTAYALNEERGKCMETGFADIITKPINPETIRTLVFRHLKILND